MSSTYSTSLKLQLIGNGEQSGIWGTTTNTNLNLVEQAITGSATITMANANYTLTNLNGVSDEARNMVLIVQGTNSGIYQVVAPLVPKLYVVFNNTTGGYAITIGGSSGSIITIPNGVTAQVFCDGSNFYSAQTGSAGNFVINGNLTVSGTTNIILPGTLNMYAGSSAPTGWLLCNGSAVSRTTYASLYSVVGTAYGAGDGSTTFNVPNLVDRMPVGAGSSYALASTGGTATTTLSTTNLPAHNHGVNDPSHAHGVADPGHAHGVYDPGHSHGGIQTFASGQGIQVGGGQYYYGNNTSVSGTGVGIYGNSTGIGIYGAYTGISTQNTGSGTAFTNLPPYLGINYIIKT